jgi:hypothetical protein
MILIAFRHSDRRLFSRLVTRVRGGDSAHVESAIPSPDGRLSLCVSSSFMDDGVRGKIIDLTDPHKWRVYRWDGDHADLMVWLRINLRVKYDTRGMLGIQWRDLGQNPGKKFCSEAVAEHIGLPDPHTYDLVDLEDYVKQRAEIVVWSGERWIDATDARSVIKGN